MALDALSFKLSLDNHLCCDPRVVGPRLPKGVATLHTVIANQSVHDRVLESMSHVQAARHVRWRNHDAIWGPLAARGKVSFTFPLLVPLEFDSVRLKGFFHLRWGLGVKRTNYT